MKVGDKVYCIKDNLSINGKKVVHIKDKVYKISYISHSPHPFTYEYLPYVIFVTSEVGGTLMYKFFNDSQPVNLGAGYFSEYFILEKEYRKLKLDRINGNINLQ